MHDLYAMKASPSPASIVFDESVENEQPLLRCWAPEIDHEIMTYIPQKPFEIATHDAMRDIGEYEYDSWGKSISFSPDNRLIALPGPKGFVKVVDLSSDLVVTEYKHGKSIKALCFSPNNALLASGTDNGSVKVVDMHTNEILSKYRHGADDVISLCFSLDNRFLTLVDDRGLCKVVDPTIGVPIRECKYDDRQLHTVSFSPDGTRVALGGFNEVLKIANIPLDKVITEQACSSLVYAIHFLPNNYLLALPGGECGSTRIIDHDKVISETFYSSDSNYSRDPNVYSLSFSPDGHLLAMGLKDGSALVIDISTDTLQAVELHDAPVRALSWSSDGRLLAIGGDDNKVTVKSMIPLLLARYCGAQTIEQYLFVKELQQHLLCEKACHLECKNNPLIVGHTRRSMLEDMPDLKKLLKIEKSLSQTQNQLWRLSEKEFKENSN